MPPNTRRQAKRQKILESSDLAKSVKVQYLLNRLDRDELEEICGHLFAESEEFALLILRRLEDTLDPKRKVAEALDMDDSVQPLLAGRNLLGTLGKLPIELLIEVFRYMTLKEKLWPITGTCKTLRNLRCVPSVWESIDTAGLNVANLQTKFLPQLMENAPRCVKYLAVDYNTHEIPHVEKLLTIAAQKQNLLALELRDGKTYISPKRLLFVKKLAKLFPDFAMQLKSFTYDQGEHSAVRQLAGAAFEVAESFPNLKRFRVHISTHYSEDALSAGPFRRLSVAGGDSRAGVPHLSANYITHLHFDGELAVRLDVLQNLGKLFPELRSAIFHHVDLPNEDTRDHFRDISSFVTRLPRLQKFDAKIQTANVRKDVAVVVSTFFFALLKQSPKLKSLSLTAFSNTRNVYRQPDPAEKFQLFSAIRSWPGGWPGLAHLCIETMHLQGFSLEYSLLSTAGLWHMPRLRKVTTPESVVIQNCGLVELMKGGGEKQF